MDVDDRESSIILKICPPTPSTIKGDPIRESPIEEEEIYLTNGWRLRNMRPEKVKLDDEQPCIIVTPISHDKGILDRLEIVFPPCQWADAKHLSGYPHSLLTELSICVGSMTIDTLTGPELYIRDLLEGSLRNDRIGYYPPPIPMSLIGNHEVVAILKFPPSAELCYMSAKKETERVDRIIEIFEFLTPELANKVIEYDEGIPTNAFVILSTSYLIPPKEFEDRINGEEILAISHPHFKQVINSLTNTAGWYVGIVDGDYSHARTMFISIEDLATGSPIMVGSPDDNILECLELRRIKNNDMREDMVVPDPFMTVIGRSLQMKRIGIHGYMTIYTIRPIPVSSNHEYTTVTLWFSEKLQQMTDMVRIRVFCPIMDTMGILEGDMVSSMY